MSGGHRVCCHVAPCVLSSAASGYPRRSMRQRSPAQPARAISAERCAFASVTLTFLTITTSFFAEQVIMTIMSTLNSDSGP
jgi:hypothetical protein